MSAAGFKSAQAAEKPALGCLGRIASFGDTAFTDSAEYIKLPIQIDGFGASPNQRLTFLYRPEWLVPGFDSAVYEGDDEAKGYLFVYRRNIAEEDGTSVLLGLCGGDVDAYNELAQVLFALDIQSFIDKGKDGVLAIPEVVKKALVEFFENHETAGKRIGYILNQQSRKTDEVGENGKAVYKRLPYYEIKDGQNGSGFYTPDEKGRLKLETRAKKSQGRFKVTFTETDIPF